MARHKLSHIYFDPNSPECELKLVLSPRWLWTCGVEYSRVGWNQFTAGVIILLPDSQMATERSSAITIRLRSRRFAAVAPVWHHGRL
jgi:hypothetical protein